MFLIYFSEFLVQKYTFFFEFPRVFIKKKAKSFSLS